MAARRNMSVLQLSVGDNLFTIGPLTAGDWIEEVDFWFASGPGTATIDVGVCAQRPGSLAEFNANAQKFVQPGVKSLAGLPSSTLVANLPLWHHVEKDHPYFVCYISVTVGGMLATVALRVRPSWR